MSTLQTLPPELVEALRADAGRWTEVRPVEDREQVVVRVAPSRPGEVAVVEVAEVAS